MLFPRQQEEKSPIFCYCRSTFVSEGAIRTNFGLGRAHRIATVVVHLQWKKCISQRKTKNFSSWSKDPIRLLLVDRATHNRKHAIKHIMSAMAQEGVGDGGRSCCCILSLVLCWKAYTQICTNCGAVADLSSPIGAAWSQRRVQEPLFPYLKEISTCYSGPAGFGHPVILALQSFWCCCTTRWAFHIGLGSRYILF